MRSVILIVLLCLAGMGYGQSELREISTGDLQVFRIDTGKLATHPFSIRYPKSFRMERGHGRVPMVGFHRYTSPLYIAVWVWDLQRPEDSIAAYSDTSTLRHYHTSWMNAPHLLADSVDTINGRAWQYHEYTVETEARKDLTWYYKHGAYSWREGTYRIDVVFSISLYTNAIQTASIFEKYKSVFRKEMETFEFTTGKK